MKFRAGDVIILLPALAVGGFLRLHLLSGQVLLDDEWHALNYVIGASYGKLFLTAPGVGATSPPMNLYTLFLLNTSGWSELWLRLPAIAAGLLSLVALPLLVWKILGRRIAFLFSLLLAISPFLIFYSRVARPYAVVALLGATSTLAFWKWAGPGERGGWRWGVLSAVAGGLAIWFHIFAAVGVLAPIAWGIGYRLYAKRYAGSESSRQTPVAGTTVARESNLQPQRLEADSSARGCGRPAMHLSFLLMAIVVSSATLLLPALLKLRDARFMDSAERGRIGIETLCGAAEIMCGTGNMPLMLVFIALALVGTGWMFWRFPLLAGGLVLSLVAYCVVFVLVRPRDIQVYVVICRYGIVVLPILMLAVACGLSAMTEAIKFRSAAGNTVLFHAAGILLCTGFFLTGPLLRTYRAPNNFTNHSAFQESYRFGSNDRFYVSQFIPLPRPVKREDVPVFYQTLARTPGITTVIEYPMVFGDHVNLLYFYQQIHAKGVKIGYFSQLWTLTAPKETGNRVESGIARSRPFVWGDDTPDDLFTKVPNRQKLQFRNMIDLADLERVRTSGADLVILHKDLTGEWSARHRRSSRATPAVQAVAKQYHESFGPPMFYDDQLIVFNLKLAKQIE